MVLAGILVIPGLWILHGRGVVVLPEAVIGASIAIWTLMFQFYFRKAEPEPPKT